MEAILMNNINFIDVIIKCMAQIVQIIMDWQFE